MRRPPPGRAEAGGASGPGGVEFGHGRPCTHHRRRGPRGGGPRRIRSGAVAPLPVAVLADVGLVDVVVLDPGEPGEVLPQRLGEEARAHVRERRHRPQHVGDGQRAEHLHRLALRLGVGDQLVGLGAGDRHLLRLDEVVEAGVVALVVVDEARRHAVVDVAAPRQVGMGEGAGRVVEHLLRAVDQQPGVGRAARAGVDHRDQRDRGRLGADVARPRDLVGARRPIDLAAGQRQDGERRGRVRACVAFGRFAVRC